MFIEGLGEYDFIIVSGATAGSVSNWNVLLLEAGGDPPIESEVRQFGKQKERKPIVFIFFWLLPIQFKLYDLYITRISK